MGSHPTGTQPTDKLPEHLPGNPTGTQPVNAAGAAAGSQVAVQGTNSAAERTLTVIGLGYIGLPTAVAFASNGWHVIGVDVKPEVVAEVNRGKLPFVEAGLEELLQQVVADGSLVAQVEPEHTQVFIVSVPTPFRENHEADLSFIEAACQSIAPLLQGDELIVLESTSPPGTTELMADWIGAARPDLRVERGAREALPATGIATGGTSEAELGAATKAETAGEAAPSDDRPAVLFAHAPERVLPGRIVYEMTHNDRIVGGLSPRATQWAYEVYSSFCDGEISTTDARTAEMAKLTENSFRDVNIAFANELSLICEELGIDVWELIELANHHPRVNILQPGPGVGGHCISVDPWFIVAADRKNSRLIQTAREVNDSKPAWVVAKAAAALAQLPANQQQVAVLGLAFKPDVDDLRESPAIEIAEELCRQYPQAKFWAVEPNVSELPREFAGFDNVELVGLEEALAASSIVLLLVDHAPFKQVTLAQIDGKQVIDTRGTWR